LAHAPRMSAKPRARGFIAEDTAAVDAHLATYDAAGAVSGIDDRSILAVLVGAIKQLWSKVLALIESDEEQNVRIKQLEDEVAALKAAAGAPSSGVPPEAPAASPVPEGTDADAGTTTAPNVAEPQPFAEEATEPASTTPVAANDNDPVVADDASLSDEPTPEPELELQGANDNQPAEDLPATGTDG
jgi:hypothetical protein